VIHPIGHPLREFEEIDAANSEAIHSELMQAKPEAKPATEHCPVARAFVADGIVANDERSMQCGEPWLAPVLAAATTTVLCESCGIHQRMRHKRRCDLCNRTLGPVPHDGERVTVETIGRERFNHDIIANAAVMAGMRMGALIRLLLDERAREFVTPPFDAVGITRKLREAIAELNKQRPLPREGAGDRHGPIAGLNYAIECIAASVRECGATVEKTNKQA
jgi:hypothetical protein